MMKAVSALRPLSRTPTISLPWLAASLALAATLGTVVLDVFLWSGQRFKAPPVSFIEGQSVYVAEMLMALAYGAVGWLLASRMWRNALGWTFLALGLAMALQMMTAFLVQASLQAFRPLDPLILHAAWLSSTAHLPLTVVLLTVVFLIFPDGRPLSRRWAIAGWAVLVGMGLVVVSVGLSPDGLLWFPALANPLAAPMAARPALAVIGGVGLVLTVVGVLAATAAMTVRYRRAEPVQQAQLRWIALAVLLLSAAGLPFVVARYALQMDYSSGAMLLTIAVVAGGFLPIAAGVAILRHRLYDIDFILNRALVYIPLTGIVGGLYTGGVAFFNRLFQVITNDRSDASIIITTLILASAFTTIRNWLQAFVDRRFKPSHGPAPALSPVEQLEERVVLLEQRLASLPPTDRQADS
jgi:hypothetical protein